MVSYPGVPQQAVSNHSADLEDFAMTTQAELGERAIGRKPFQHDGVYELKE